MDDQYLNMLQYAAGVPAPLRLKVQLEGAEAEVLTFTKPYLVIGRHSDCDIVVQNRSVSARHLYLQAIGSRIAAIDLHSTAGTDWGVPEFNGWLNSDQTVKIPGAEIQLCDSFWMEDSSLKPPKEFRPRDEHRDEYGLLPKVDLELLNTSAKGKKWPINRVMTLIGSHEGCRITIVDKNISKVHCSLLLLPSGLWVIDLTGQGKFTVNGQQGSCMMLSEGTDLQLGPYHLAARYPDLVMPPTSTSTLVENAAPVENSEREFLTQQNRIFRTRSFGETIVILPQGDSQEFFYKDIHVEANRVIDVIKKRNFKHVVIDFSESETVGHILVESLSSFCRSAPEKSALCACTVATYEMLHMTKLFNIWPHYQTREDALQAVLLIDE